MPASTFVIRQSLLLTMTKRSRMLADSIDDTRALRILPKHKTRYARVKAEGLIGRMQRAQEYRGCFGSRGDVARLDI